MGKWYYASERKQHGPYSAAQMMELVGSAKIRPTDLVWTESMNNWRPLASVPELAGVVMAGSGVGSSSSGAPAAIESSSGGTPAAIASDAAVEVAVALPEALPESAEARPVIAAAKPAILPNQMLQYANPTADSGVALNASGLQSLARAKFWARFVGVCFLVFGGLLCVVVIAMIVTSGMFSSGGRMYSFILIPAATYAVTAMIMILIGLSANRFASAAKRAVGSRRPEDLAAAMVAQHATWRLAGIIIITYLGLIACAVVVGIVGLL